MFQSSGVPPSWFLLVIAACWMIGPSAITTRAFQNDPDHVRGVLLRDLSVNNTGTTSSPQQPRLSEADLVCKGAKQAHYATDLEMEKDPCDCDYNVQTRNLIMECQYDYCPECSAEVNLCGIRVVKMSTTLTEQDLALFFESNSTLTIGTSKQYCIQYTEGEFSKGKLICTTIFNSFNTGSCSGDRFGDLPYGLPLLTCTPEQGCACFDNNEATTDAKDPFAGFAVLEFETCYNPNATATTSLSSSSSSSWSFRLDTQLSLFFGGVWGMVSMLMIL